MNRVIVCLSLLFLAGMGFSSEPHRASHPEKYVNSRFGFEVRYPSGSFVPQGESDNGDGQRFLSSDGLAEWTVSGMDNVLDQSLSQAFDDELLVTGRRVTYKQLNRNFFVVSGMEGPDLVYVKKMLRDGVYYTLMMRYPASARKTYDPVLHIIEKSFQMTRAKPKTAEKKR